ncbi:MAG: glycosyltransferase family 4 protein [Cyclobacteriaceae bacterium]|nr:glycosyltransferase family 4 protein [Cyclobacteriaceae bacterium]
MKKVMFVNSGIIRGDRIETSSFVQSQALSLSHHWEVIWGLTGWDSTSLKSMFLNILKLRELNKNSDLSIVHAQYGSINSFIAMMATKGKPFVVSFCGDDLLGTIQPGIKWRIREAVAKFLSLVTAFAADHIIVKSENIKRALPGIWHRKVTIIPNGVDTSFFRPLDKLDSRKELGLSNGKYYVLFNHSVGNNLLRKNKPLADAAINKVKLHFPEVELLVTGRVPHHQMPLYINSADVVLLTSLHEGSPNIIKEAMASNVPVVSVPCGDALERITDDSIGYVCPYDAEELADKIVLILKDNRSSTGRDSLIKQGLSTEDVSKKIELVYNLVLSK